MFERSKMPLTCSGPLIARMIQRVMEVVKTTIILVVIVLMESSGPVVFMRNQNNILAMLSAQIT